MMKNHSDAGERTGAHPLFGAVDTEYENLLNTVGYNFNTIKAEIAVLKRKIAELDVEKDEGKYIDLYSEIVSRQKDIGKSISILRTLTSDSHIAERTDHSDG